MSIKKKKPITSSQRFKIINSFKEITKHFPEKTLSRGKNKTGGRNNCGKMTIRYRGGGHKKKYRRIDYKRNKFGITAIIKSIEYDPNRSSFISLLFYKDGEKRYILSIDGLEIGKKIISDKYTIPELGNAMYIMNIPLGTIISCVELFPGKGAIFARSAGAYVQLIAKSEKFSTIKLPSGETRMVYSNCMATIGSIANSDHKLEIDGKAGRKRWLGKRPRTRGVAMNPVDHPMGGGEGKASGGHPRNRNGLPSNGFKTRDKKKKSNKFIINKKYKK
ncbi:MAG: 50S ribosomal protein L2 [Candidatus Karelsulcia muelleri]